MKIEDLYALYRQHPDITTDTRTCREGSVFFALKGENFNGNSFLRQALDKGCSYVIGDTEEKGLKDKRMILVEDSLKTLQKLANYHRKRISVPLIGITGTNGKTTTKELCAHILSGKFKVLFTEGNLNNHIGVPLTLLKIRPEHEIAIIEMGASHPGDIKELVDIAEPDFGIITNVGKAHLQGFGSFEGVIRTKGELYDFIRAHKGKIFINKNNPYLEKISHGIEKIYYATEGEALVNGKVLSSFPFINFEWTAHGIRHEVGTNLIGSYNLENLLASVCMGIYFGVPDTTICKKISEYTPNNHRSEFKKTANNNLIIDAYNANPSSMKAALNNFKEMDVRPKMLILGDMKELGKYSEEEHKKIIEALAQGGFDKILLCGENYFSTKAECPACIKFATTEDLIAYLGRSEIKGYNILIKGSHANHLEKTLPLL